MTKFSWIRHAPSIPAGRVYGRTDAAADVCNSPRLEHARARVGRFDRLVCSPARRCGQTAAALWPERTPEPIQDLWEQNFGDFDGLEFSALPDLGEQGAEYLAEYRWPGGESFDDVYERVSTAIEMLRGDNQNAHVVAVAHAGTIRAALAVACGGGPAAGLSFRVEPLCVVEITALDGAWRIDGIDNP